MFAAFSSSVVGIAVAVDGRLWTGVPHIGRASAPRQRKILSQALFRVFAPNAPIDVSNVMPSNKTVRGLRPHAAFIGRVAILALTQLFQLKGSAIFLAAVAVMAVLAPILNAFARLAASRMHAFLRTFKLLAVVPDVDVPAFSFIRFPHAPREIAVLAPIAPAAYIAPNVPLWR